MWLIRLTLIFFALVGTAVAEQKVKFRGNVQGVYERRPALFREQAIHFHLDQQSSCRK